MSDIGFRPQAAADIQAAFDWYEQQRPGLGDEFLTAVDVALAAVAEFPKAHPVVHRGARRALLPRFPYGLYYLARESRILVIACMHAARDPELLRGRLDG